MRTVARHAKDRENSTSYAAPSRQTPTIVPCASAGKSRPADTTRTGAAKAHGMLPYALFEQIRLKFIALLKARIARRVPRTE